MQLLKNKIILLIIVLGSLLWTLTMVKSGTEYEYGIGYWGPNGHDGIWHLALINGISKGSLEMPIFAGEDIKNYHLGFDLLIAIAHRLTGISVENLYFKIFPPIAALLIGYLVYRMVLDWKKSKTQALWAVFFTYISGSFGWVVTYLKNRTFDGESIFWAQQSLSTLINPPYALSLIIFLAGIIFFMKYESLKNTKFRVFALICFGILAQIKIYAGLLIIFALFATGVRSFFLKRSKNILLFSFIVFSASFLILLPTYNFSSGNLILKPFWFLEGMVSSPDRFYWPKMASAIFNYQLSGNFVKLTIAYTLLLALFIVGNAGLRIIAFPSVVKKIFSWKRIQNIEFLLLIVIITGILIPIFVVQSGNMWNSVQFFYYSLFFLSILSGIEIGKIFERMSDKNSFRLQLIRRIITIFILLLSIPPVISTLRHYLPSNPPAKISKEEIQALRFLNTLPNGVVLSCPYDKNVIGDYYFAAPVPLYAYQSTAYVTFYGDKSSYLEDEVNLDITGYKWKERKAEVLKYLESPEKLKTLGIDYYYVPNKDLVHCVKFEFPTPIYDRDGVLIYKL